MYVRYDPMLLAVRMNTSAGDCDYCHAPSATFRCSRFRKAKFCDTACFRSAWKTHKVGCSVRGHWPPAVAHLLPSESSESRRAQGSIVRGRVFVSIAAYRDPELKETLKALLHQSTRPDLLYVGLVWQGDEGDDEPLNEESLDMLQSLWRVDVNDAGPGNRWLPTLPGQRKIRAQLLLGGRLRVVRMAAADARGPCWARYLAQLLWEGEELYLQLDSHMRFVPAWDDKARQQLLACTEHSSKPVLCSYGRAYPLGLPFAETPQNLTACLNCAAFFDSNNVLNIRYRSLLHDWDKPRTSFFWSAHFSFSSAEVLKEVPYDPRLLMLFFGEEILMTVRLFTHGWDLFSPSSGVVFHLWQRDYRKVYAEDMSELYRDLSHSSRKRLHAMLGSGPPLFFEEGSLSWPLPGCADQPASFELGHSRSLADYERAAGVSFRDRHLSEFALRGGAPSEECFLTQEEGGQMAVEKQCRSDMSKAREKDAEHKLSFTGLLRLANGSSEAVRTKRRILLLRSSPCLDEVKDWVFENVGFAAGSYCAPLLRSRAA